jgi:hypothetical protein
VQEVQQETESEEVYLLPPETSLSHLAQAFDLEEGPEEGHDDYLMLLQCSQDSILELEGLMEAAEAAVLVQHFDLAEQKRFHLPFPRPAFAKYMT